MGEENNYFCKESYAEQMKRVGGEGKKDEKPSGNLVGGSQGEKITNFNPK